MRLSEEMYFHTYVHEGHEFNFLPGSKVPSP